MTSGLAMGFFTMLQTPYIVCNWDGGDSCSMDNRIDLCSECECISTKNVQVITTELLVCPLPQAINDGFCNEENRQNPICHNYGTDCGN